MHVERCDGRYILDSAISIQETQAFLRRHTSGKTVGLQL